MVSLKDLTVPLIDKLTEECDIQFKSGDRKADKITKIESSSISPSRLEALIQKYLAMDLDKSNSYSLIE